MSSNSELRGLKPGARVCLVSDSAQRGVLESASGGWWAVKFADKTRSIRVANLKLPPSDAASFEPPQAPLSRDERRVAAPESSNRGLCSKRGMSVAASANKCAICPITLK